MVGPQFRYVGATDMVRDIADVGALDSTMAGYNNDWIFQNTMLVWDPATKGYTTYGWSGTSGTDVDGDPSYDNQWLNESLEVTDDTIDLGSGVWIQTSSAGSVTISGEVPSEATVTIPLVAGYNMVSCPYPGTVPVASFGTLSSSMAGYNNDWIFQNTMLVWDPATKGYTTYGWSGTSGTDVDGDPSYDNQWLNESLEVTTDTIPFGAGVWIQAATSGSITFTSPVAE